MEIIIILILIGINGILALAEIAFVSARRELIEASESQGNKNAALVLKMMETPDRFLSVIQIGITLIGIVSGTFSGIALSENFAVLIEQIPFCAYYSDTIALIIVVTIVTYLSIVLGELVPKSIALKNPERFILALMPSISVFSTVMKPVVSFLSLSTICLLRMIGLKPGSIDENSDPVKEILGIAKMAAVKNKIDHEQEKIIKNTITTLSLTVEDIMVSKDDMRVLTTDMSPADALVASHVHHHTRYPLIDSSLGGTVIGYVNFKDIVNTLRLNPLSPSLRGIRRPIVYVSAGDKVTEVLQNLIRIHQHIAMVRNDKGQICGLITLENILETIVGDIKDEYDTPPEYLYDINETRLLAGGGITLAVLRERLGQSIPDVNKTLCQWLLEIADKPLKVETAVNFNGIRYEIRKMSRSKISEIIIDFAGAETPQSKQTDPVR